MRVYEIPEGSKTAKGRAIQNLINIEQDDKVKAFICTQDLKDEEYINNHYVIMATKKGQVKKTALRAIFKTSMPMVLTQLPSVKMMNFLEARLNQWYLVKFCYRCSIWKSYSI